MRTVMAVVAGAGVGFLCVAGVEALGHMIYPPPAMEVGDPAGMAATMARMPSGALVAVVAAWWLGTLAGSLTAGALDPYRPGLSSGIVGTLVLAATVANLMLLPHPTWMAVAGIAGILVIICVSVRVSQGRTARRA